MTILELINNIFPIFIKFLIIWIIAKSVVAVVEIERGNKEDDDE